ncbi:MAG: hypothetical protein RR069_04870 [Oscillospiraceae bacterium]
MRDLGIVQGSATQAVPLVIGKDTVYVHTNITRVKYDSQGNAVEGLFQHNEIQYDKDEYIKLMAERNEQQEMQLTNTQVALTELYESVVVK